MSADTSAAPSGMHTITPHLWYNGNCREAVSAYQKAFGAQLVAEPESVGDHVVHAMLKFGDSLVMMADSAPGACEKGPIRQFTTAGLHLLVPDVDAAHKQAVDAGFASVQEPEDMYWGARSAKVKDSFGHVWALSTPKARPSGEDYNQAMMSRFNRIHKTA